MAADTCGHARISGPAGIDFSCRRPAVAQYYGKREQCYQANDDQFLMAHELSLPHVSSYSAPCKRGVYHFTVKLYVKILLAAGVIQYNKHF